MVRGKRPEADLRRTYAKVLSGSVGLSALIHLCLLLLFPTFEYEPMAQTSRSVVIELEQIPETAPLRRPPPPPRPVVPIASTNEWLSDDITIETTELDLSLDHLLEPPPPLPKKLEPDVQIDLEEEEEEIVELWQVEKEPTPLKKTLPAYPEVARKAGMEAKVFIHVLVGKTGKVEGLGRYIGPPVFHQAVEKAATQWVFAPALQNDMPVKVWLVLPFDFRLH